MPKVIKPPPKELEYIVDCPRCEAVLSFTQDEVCRDECPDMDGLDLYINCPCCDKYIYFEEDYKSSFKIVETKR
jgi:hypothetical protein